MESWTPFLVIGGLIGFFTLLGFLQNRVYTRRWFEAVTALGLTPGGRYPSLTAMGKWAGGDVAVSHFQVGAGKSSVTWHVFTFSRPGLSREPIPTEAAGAGFLVEAQQEQYVLRADGALTVEQLQRLLNALPENVPVG